MISMTTTITRIKLKGLARYLLTRAHLRLSSVPKNSMQEISPLGQKIMLNLHDLEQKYLYADCVREPENLFVYRAIAETEFVNTFIDIGANCGHVALSVLDNYPKLLLFEPNPKLAEILRTIFNNRNNVVVKECAIVDESSVGELTLTVPLDSSGLATLGATELSKKHLQNDSYTIKASTLAKEIDGYALENSYIKIDVEGFEANIIDSTKYLINLKRPIVGYEALSRASALECSRLFKDYVFYCSRFDFLESGGTLMNSFAGMIKGLLFGANIEVIRLNDLDSCHLNNFSQVYSVPVEKSAAFEKILAEYCLKKPIFNLSTLKTWSV
jgi:FkbM family methyltransferase